MENIKSVFDETERLLRISKDISITIEPAVISTKEIKTTRETSKNKPFGYCIRTGVKIPFNTEKPLSPEAFKAWNKYGDVNYPEKFCHYSGESSNGETSVAKPILKKNWKKAQNVSDK